MCDRMLDTRGDTAIYLLFAYARLKSILRKAKEEKGIDVDTVVADGKVVLEHQVGTPQMHVACMS
jgi:arginyl-tRNA synthetase